MPAGVICSAVMAQQRLEAYCDGVRPDGGNVDETVAVLIGCGDTKMVTSGPVPAEQLYLATYFGMKAEYARLRADAGCGVLSAKYGVVGFGTGIDTYDSRLGRDVDSDPWARRVIRDLGLGDRVPGVEADPGAVPAPICRADTLEILAGRDYVDALQDVGLFEAWDGRVRLPFDEEPEAQGGIGYQMGWLSDEIERLSTSG